MWKAYGKVDRKDTRRLQEVLPLGGREMEGNRMESRRAPGGISR